VTRAFVTSTLLVAGFLAAALAAACATGASSDSSGGDDGGGEGGEGGGGDGTVSESGAGSDGGLADHADASCAPSGPATTCNGPTNLGSLMPAQTATSTGNLVPAGQDAYFTVTFNGNTSEDYHPSITLTKGASEFLFDVTSDCAGTTLYCGDPFDAGPSTGVTTWEVEYTGGDFNSEAAAGTDGAFDPIPPVGNLGVVYVHLYRKSGLPVSCNEYVLTVGN
jgi:hypothetical protein